ncbi:MAG: hypothetical protein G01um101425_492 [Candidatus Peregrinibacteria bacterium Gr01-1014_25]|nr:MAG: hypothetical protein G01um101425_492 [Candidatus Peregrinibacteria bacterium Gr01-1014_25]
MDRLDSLLPRTLRKHGLYEHARAARIAHLADAWLKRRLGPLGGAARVEKVDGKTLIIACDRSVVAQEVSSGADELLAELRSCGKEAAPTAVRVLRTRREGLAKGM